MYTCGYFLRYKKRISLKFFSQKGPWYMMRLVHFFIFGQALLAWSLPTVVLQVKVTLWYCSGSLFVCINDYLKLIEILEKKYYPRHFIMYLLNLFGLAGCNCENKTKLELPFCYYTLPSFTVFCWPPWILIPFFEMFKNSLCLFYSLQSKIPTWVKGEVFTGLLY